MSSGSVQFYQAWDLPTRWFHWINFACVLSLAAIGTAILYDKELGVTDAGKVFLKSTHVWFGYIFALNLIWRIVWAFVGSPYSRWSSILPFQSGYIMECKSYILGMIRGDPRPYLGHNPIARFMVTLLLILLLVQAVTGLVLAGTDIYYPPLGHWITAWIAAPGVDPSTIVPYDKTGIDPARLGRHALLQVSVRYCPLLVVLRTVRRCSHPYCRRGCYGAARGWRYCLFDVYWHKGI